MIIVIYTDDCLLYARDTKDIDSFVKTLCDDYKLTLNDPDTIDDFLGIHFSHQDNGELHMSQTGLIGAVTESAHIPKGRLKIPQHQLQQSYTLINKDLHAKNHGQNSQPEKSFSVHQCARFSKEPKSVHEK
jgi:hypothetical protein